MSHLIKAPRKIVIFLGLKFPFVNLKISRDHSILHPKSISINWLTWLWGGFVLLFISAMFNHFHVPPEYEDGKEVLHHICRDLALAIISAALIANIIEVPTLINFVNDRTIEALSNDNFLKTLSEDQLTSIKKSCTKLLFEKKGKKTGDQMLNESLIEYELEISNLLLSAYYEYFKLNIYCEDIVLEDSKGNKHGFMKKVYKRNYKIVNPLRGSTEIDILASFNMQCPREFQCNNLVELNKVLVNADSGQIRDVTSLFETTVINENVKHPNYNCRVDYKLKDVNNSKFKFTSEIIIETEETRFISQSDPIYVLRINRPAKNVSINYSYNNANTKLKVEGFGSYSSWNDGNFIKMENGNSITFETLKWLLPGNGIIISNVMGENKI